VHEKALTKQPQASLVYGCRSAAEPNPIYEHGDHRSDC
jgi:hypothetical protein